MWKRALVSVSDKTGLVEFLRPLQQQGLQIFSTGGTAKHLTENGLKIHDVSELTEFPEVLGGRVKTLHPHVHMGLLARRENSEDMATLAKFKVEMFDLVVVNLYPFEAALLEGKTGAALIEKIDVGGPTMLRAAAKNHKYISVLCDPNDYAEAAKINSKDNDAFNLSLAAKVFAHTAAYDSLITAALSEEATKLNFESKAEAAKPQIEAAKPQVQVFATELLQSLRYGENPHQTADWYIDKASRYGWQQAQILQGKELSYNNLLDLDAALLTLKLFADPTCVAVKHNNPCGVGESLSLSVAVMKAVKADPVSVFGGIIAINRKVTKEEALILSEIFLECVVAVDYSDEALQIFSKKKNLRILKWPNMLDQSTTTAMRQISGGWLRQDLDSMAAEWTFLGETPNDNILKDLVFAEKCAAALKSNSIAIVRDQQSLGFGMGQVNRVEAVEHAISRAKRHHLNLETAVLASDAFFPFKDSVQLVASAGLKWILQPGGSLRDQEVIECAKDLGVNLVLTGKRHFRH